MVASVSGAVITFTTDLTASDANADTNEIIRGPVCTYAPACTDCAADTADSDNNLATVCMPCQAGFESGGATSYQYR